MTMTMPWKAPDETHTNGAVSKLDEMRRAFSQEAERLGQVAAQYGHDAGTHVSTIAHDPVGSANSGSRQLVQTLATLGTAIALSSRRAAKEARSVRLTTESRKTGPDLVPAIALLAGLGAGLALMYFLDRERGERRRKMLGDRLLSWTRRSPAASTTATEVGEPPLAAEETHTWDTGELDEPPERPLPQPQPTMSAV